MQLFERQRCLDFFLFRDLTDFCGDTKSSIASVVFEKIEICHFCNASTKA